MGPWNRSKPAPAKRRALTPSSDLGRAGVAEVLRVWIIGQRLHTVVRPSAISPGGWGIMLADLMRHAAHAWAAKNELPDDAYVDDIRLAYSQHRTSRAGFGSDAQLTVAPPGTGELPEPAAVSDDPNDGEILRLAIPSEAGFVMAWANLGAPEPWGYVAADLSCHVARAYSREGAVEAKVLAEIHALTDAEWRRPTDEITGAIGE